MKKVPKSSLLAERLHKGFVCTCIAVTIYGCSVMAIRGYRYYTEIKPELQRKQNLEKQSLLEEGSSDNLRDIAPNIHV
ncbi:unnamed protein product [Tenebrio molitor]|jgi:hypothetical protein|nr:unnamed protein product [Tenebrio molitor]